MAVGLDLICLPCDLNAASFNMLTHGTGDLRRAQPEGYRPTRGHYDRHPGEKLF